MCCSPSCRRWLLRLPHLFMVAMMLGMQLYDPAIQCCVLIIILPGADLGPGFENRSSWTQIEGTTYSSLVMSGDTTLIDLLTVL
jgi:hypothetical protein